MVVGASRAKPWLPWGWPSRRTPSRCRLPARQRLWVVVASDTLTDTHATNNPRAIDRAVDHRHRVRKLLLKHAAGTRVRGVEDGWANEHGRQLTSSMHFITHVGVHERAVSANSLSGGGCDVATRAMPTRAARQEHAQSTPFTHTSRAFARHALSTVRRRGRQAHTQSHTCKNSRLSQDPRGSTCS